MRHDIWLIALIFVSTNNSIKKITETLELLLAKGTDNGSCENSGQLTRLKQLNNVDYFSANVN